MCDRTLLGKLLIVLTIAGGIVAMPALPVSAQQERDLADSEITRAVERFLAAGAAVPDHLVDVTTLDGVVTLEGTVPNLLAVQRARKVALGVQGVRAVTNSLAVRTPKRRDGAIKRDIRDAMAADMVTEMYDVDVDVDDQIVRLRGTVQSYTEKKYAEHMAMSVRGVRKVRNDLEVNYRAERDDREIRTEVRQRLNNDTMVDAGLVEVEVDDGDVMLSGFVGSAAQKDRAVTDSWVAGVDSVDAEGLEVRWWARDEMRRASRDIPDERIQNALRDALLFNLHVPAAEVAVEVENGVAELQGSVQSLRAKREAERSAKNTAGVVYVISRIKVRPREVPEDEKLKEKVQEALARDPWGWDKDITVRVSNGEVSLYGNVDSQFEQSYLANLAAGVQGVVALNNFLKVREKYPRKPDAEMRATLNEFLAWDPEVDDENISVVVRDGKVTLEGTVADFEALDAAVENAWLAGAKSVVNELTVEGVGDVHGRAP